MSADPGPGILERLTGVPFLIMLDIDGTLAPTAPRPELAAVPVDTRRALAALARQPGVSVCLVSGRPASEARRMISVVPIWVIGNHGAELIDPNGQTEIDSRVAPWAGLVAQAARRLECTVAAVPGALLEDKQWTLSVHYRAVDPAAVPALRAAVTDTALGLGLVVRDGKRVIEVRPPVPVNKGTAVLDLAERLGALASGASLLCAGDDDTDEDAFRALRARVPRAVTMHVGDGEGPTRTAAEILIDDPWEMSAFLIWLAAARAEVAA